MTEYRSQSRYRSFNFEDVLEEMTRPSETYAQTAARFQLLREQLARSTFELRERMGEEKYAEWYIAMIRPLDDPGEILQKVDEELARLTCGPCPFDYDPSMCGVCHEHGLGVK